MRDTEYRKVKVVFERLVAELDLRNTMIIDCLFTEGVLTLEDKDDLSRIPTSHEKNCRLLEMLKTKEDAAYGKFRDAVEKYQSHLAADLDLPGVPRRTPRSRATGGGKSFEDFTVKDLQDWLHPRLQKENIPDIVLELIADQDIDGKVFMNMTGEDLKEVFSDLKFGPRKKLALLRDEVTQVCPPMSMELRLPSLSQQRKEHARQFAKTPKAMEKYHQNRMLNVHETCLDNSLLSPTRQFFPCCEDGERADIYAFIAEKVVIFSAACMNDRRNGTIYFGVGNKDCEHYRYGEVLGIPLDKKQCEDEIMLSLRNSFCPDTVEAALKCVRAVFMEVVLSDEKEGSSHFVCKVDIQPKSEFIDGLTFFLNIADTTSSGKKQILYRLDNGIPTEQVPDKVIKFAEEKRRLSEERQLKDKQAPSEQAPDKVIKFAEEKRRLSEERQVKDKQVPSEQAPDKIIKFAEEKRRLSEERQLKDKQTPSEQAPDKVIKFAEEKRRLSEERQLKDKQAPSEQAPDKVIKFAEEKRRLSEERQLKDKQAPSEQAHDKVIKFAEEKRRLSDERQLKDKQAPSEQAPDKVIKFAEEKRRLSEERQLKDKQAPCPRAQNLPQLLKNFLCGGMDQLDESFCHLLVVGAVDTSGIEVKDSFEFVADMDWRGILDFDPKSGENGLYQYMDKKKKMLYKVKMTEEFSSEEPGGNKQTVVDGTGEEIDESQLKPWIFCNGHEAIDEKGQDIKQWKKERGGAFREVVSHFVHNIPNGRAVVVILLTSKDDIFIEASEELLLRFPDQWVMLAKSEQLANEWIDGLQQRGIEVNPDRCLYSFSFAEINKAIHQLMKKREVSDKGCYVKSSSGVEEQLSKKQVQGLCDLDILSTMTCSIHPENASEFSKNHEHNFYRCNEATWWNFYFSGHVCPRDKLDDLKTATHGVLEGDVEEDETVGFLGVYHQPGSGGTTIAMNVLWDLHHEYKCCRLKQFSSDSARQILTLYEVGENNPQRRRKPVLVMIDNADDDRVNELKRLVEEECQCKDVCKLACVFLICIRCKTLPADHQKKNIFLQHKLSSRERQFFVDKYTELKKKDNSNMDYLLSLNIMKEDFNEDYIKRTVAGFIQRYTESERVLLQHIALLNSYDLQFRAIPVSCFDELMSQQGGKKPWESVFTPDPLMLFTFNYRLSGRNKCLRVTNKLLCLYILDHLADHRVAEESHTDMMENFLHSALFQRHSSNFAIKDLLNITKDCMKKRGLEPSGMKRCRFSPFIQMLVDAGNDDDAIRCIETVFERTEDAFLAQQIARIHIFRKNWDDAEQWANRAIQIWPNCSFVLDTLGQIFKSRLAECREECNRNQKQIDTSEAVQAVKNAYDGYRVFERVQTLNDKEANDPPNVSGFFGQMEIVSTLFDILEFHPAFPSKGDVQKFLSGDRNITDVFTAVLDQDVIEWLASLEDKAFSCLKEVENQKMMCSTSGIECIDVLTLFFLGEDNMRHFEDKLNDRFGLMDQKDKGAQQYTTEERQRIVTKLGGNSLYSIMTQCGQGQEGQKNTEKIWDYTSLSLKGQGVKDQKSKFRNLNMALASALTLISCHGRDVTEEEYGTILQWSMELFQMTEKPDPQKFINVDPYIYLFVFHWPAANQQHVNGQCAAKKLKEAIELTKNAFAVLGKEKPKKNNPIFFLTKGPGAGKVISKNRLRTLCGKQTEGNVSRLLKDAKAVKTVDRFDGVLVNNGNMAKMKLKTSQGKEAEVHIPLFVHENDQSLWNKKVSLVLGVGLGGPVACDVSSAPASPFHSSSRDAGRHGRLEADAGKKAAEQKQAKKSQQQ